MPGWHSVCPRGLLSSSGLEPSLPVRPLEGQTQQGAEEFAGQWPLGWELDTQGSTCWPPGRTSSNVAPLLWVGRATWLQLSEGTCHSLAACSAKQQLGNPRNEVTISELLSGSAVAASGWQGCESWEGGVVIHQEVRAAKQGLRVWAAWTHGRNEKMSHASPWLQGFF